MDGSAVIGLKLLVAAAASAVSGAVVTEVITRTERIVLGVPQSWLLAAVVGALIGVLLLSPLDAGKITLPQTGSIAARWSTLLLRVALFGGFIAGFAILAGWLVVLLTTQMPSLRDVGVALTGLCGASIKPMLPHYLGLLQRFTDRLARRTGDTA